MAAEYEKDNDPVVIVVSGAGNARERHFPPVLSQVLALEHLHAKVTHKLHQPILDMSRHSELVVPPSFGLAPFHNTYESTEPVIRHKAFKHDGRPIVLVGHSLGGLIAARYASEHPDQVVASVSIASPFEGVRHIPNLPFDRIVGLHENTQHIREMREDLGDQAPRLRLIGGKRDELVTPESALPDLPDADRFLLTDDPVSAAAHGYTPVEYYGAPGHLGVLTNPGALALCYEVIREPNIPLAV